MPCCLTDMIVQCVDRGWQFTGSGIAAAAGVRLLIAGSCGATHIAELPALLWLAGPPGIVQRNGDSHRQL